MVKIAILSHGLIHNTRVILSLLFSTHLYTKHIFLEYSGQKKPLVRNGGNCNTDFKETILIVLILCSIQNVGTARDS